MSGEALAALIWCPFPSEDAAREIAGQLLDRRLVACANILPGMSSLFSWQGERSEGAECGTLFKTTASLRESAMRRLAELHPYEVPAVTGWTVFADAGTLEWLEAETQAG